MDDNAIRWPSPPATDLSLEPDAVHVWAISLQVSDEAFHDLMKIFTPEERQRAEAFRFDRDRTRWVAARAALRMILGRYLRVQPALIEFQQGAHGKPMLAAHMAAAGLQFNLTHCEDLALLAIARDREIGIDLERIRPMEDAEDMIANFCSTQENAKFRALAKSDKDVAFFRIWTGKEAWLKAVGDGIGTSLDQVEVSFAAGEPSRFLSLPKGAGTDVQNWTLLELTPVSGFIVALAIPGSATNLCCWRWDEQDQLQRTYD